MNSEIIQIIEDALSEKAVKEVHINVADGDSVILDTRDIDTFVKGLQAFAAAVKSPKKNRPDAGSLIKYQAFLGLFSRGTLSMFLVSLSTSSS